jgi:hypothetical protein
MVSRHYGPGRSIPTSPIYSELELTKEEIAEIEYRFEALKPYQKPGSPSFAAAAYGQETLSPSTDFFARQCPVKFPGQAV